VGRLFERLLADGVTVVTTSNRPPEGLYKDGLNRQLFLPFIALLRDRLEVLELDGGDDYRRAADRGHPAYFTPLGAEASARMDALWTRVAGRHGDPLDIDVLGRTIRVSRHVDRIGRSDFWDLCGRPLGAADYLALAERHRIFFIDAVPRLSRANFNEARRFVTLVDALYDARIPLAVSAADRPERLYVEGEGSFAFARTASRLHEMTGAFWETVPAGA
ncbi:MAG: cell division protein ZapE, partial [Alphaproteobacteria bacterium]